MMVTLEQLAAKRRTAMAAQDFGNCPFCDVDLVCFIDGGIGATTDEPVPHPANGCVRAEDRLAEHEGVE